MSALGCILECVAVLLLLVSYSHTRTAHEVEAAGGKPARVPEFHEFGATDAERASNALAWAAKHDAPDSYIGASKRSRSYGNMALLVALLGGLCMLLDGGAP